MITLKLRDVFTNNDEELLIREYPEDLIKMFIETQNIGLGVDNVFFFERFVIENPEVLDGLGKLYYVRDLKSFPAQGIDDLSVQNKRGKTKTISNVDYENIFISNEYLLYGESQIVDLNGYSPSKNNLIDNLNLLSWYGIAPYYKDLKVTFPFFKEPTLNVTILSDTGEHDVLLYGNNILKFIMLTYKSNIDNNFYYSGFVITKIQGQPMTDAIAAKYRITAR